MKNYERGIFRGWVEATGGGDPEFAITHLRIVKRGTFTTKSFRTRVTLWVAAYLCLSQCLRMHSKL